MLKVEAELIARWLISTPPADTAVYDSSCIMLTSLIDQGHVTEDEIRQWMREFHPIEDADDRS